MDRSRRIRTKDIDESHYHIHTMKLVRSCMTTSTPCIEQGCSSYADLNLKQYQKKLSTLEKKEKKHVLEHKSETFDAFVSQKHVAFFGMKNMPRDGTLTIVFRQSYCKCNWISNLQWLPRSQDGIHSGFYFIGNTIFDQLKRYLDEEAPKFDKVIFTGMSLGGALCALMAYRIATETDMDVRKMEVIQFASPKVGLREWSDKYNTVFCARSYHYHSSCDLFANSPPPHAGDYQCVGSQILVDDFGFGNHLHMRAHSQIMGLSFMTEINLPLCASMLIRGDRILKAWETLMSLMNTC